MGVKKGQSFYIPTQEEEEMIKTLKKIAKKHRELANFLEEVFKSFSSFEESIRAIASWLGLGLDHREFFKEIITQSLSLPIDERVAWKLIDTKSKSDSYKEMFTRVTKRMSDETGIKMPALELIKSIREHHPVWKEKIEQAGKKKEIPASATLGTGETMDFCGGSVDLSVDMAMEEDRSARIARAKEEARQRKADLQKKLTDLENDANNTTDINELKKILRELYQYNKDFHLKVEQIRKMIRAKIKRIEDKEDIGESQDQKRISEIQDLKEYILLGLTQGNLDVKQAKERLEKYAKTFASQSEKSCRILSLRITPEKCKSQVIIAVHEELQRKASDYPIVEGNETFVIQQLISLGISEQSATGAVIENLCFSKRFKSAKSIIDAYKAKYENIEIGAITDEKERGKITAQREIMPQVIEKWTRRVLECARKENSAMEIWGMPEK